MASSSPATEAPLADQRSVAIVLTRRVRRENTAAFEAGLRDLIRTASRQPGQLHAEVLRGARGPRSQDYHVVYRFEDHAQLRAWEASAHRRVLAARVEALADDAGRRQLTGLEVWFDLPATPPPPRARMALLTWLGIWPLVTLALLQLAPRLTALPLIARTAVITALLVLAMTYLMMPLLTRLATPWLNANPNPSPAGRR